MSVQKTYDYATGKGIAGGIYDMYHYQVDSRFSEVDNGKLLPGMGVVQGTVVGSSVKLPGSTSKADEFEGVVVNGFTNQYDLEGHLSVTKNSNIGVMRKGRIWVRLKKDAKPAYGDEVHLIKTDDDNAGLFSNKDGEKISGRFLGSAEGDIAPVELYGDIPGAAADP